MTPERFTRLKAILDQRQIDLTVIMEDVHKPRNIAAIMRSCDAVGIQQIHAVAPHGVGMKRPKSAAGVLRYVRTRRHSDIRQAIAAVRKQGCRVVVAHPGEQARDFRDYDYTRPTALLFGSELIGVSNEALAEADETVVIPMHGMVASLNVSVSAALILYEAQRQRAAAGMYDTCQLDAATYQKLLFEFAWPHLAHRYRGLGWDYPEINLDSGSVDWQEPKNRGG
ncbi:MAG: tRNA (guanosine(18)-2'-O)-methyltransferase TrmH [Granulosicoccaceae bacterium]|jgi:tRNA (guanosine-2'-O-)-methyltransferase